MSGLFVVPPVSKSRRIMNINIHIKLQMQHDSRFSKHLLESINTYKYLTIFDFLFGKIYT